MTDEETKKTFELYKFDLASHYVPEGSDREQKTIAMAKFRSDGRAFQFEITGDMATQGINESEFKKQLKYSVGVTTSEATQNFLEQLKDVIDNYLSSTPGIVDAASWEVVDPLKDGETIYLKLPTDKSGKNFQFKTNVKISPKNYSEAAQCSSVHFTGEVKAYFNLIDKKAGLSFVPKTLNFDETEESSPFPAPKRVKA